MNEYYSDPNGEEFVAPKERESFPGIPSNIDVCKFPGIPSNIDVCKIIGSAALGQDSDDTAMMWRDRNGDFTES